MADSDSATPGILRPVAEAERIESLDVLRGFALLGILPMNIRSFATPFAAYMNPTLMFDFSGLNRLAFLFTHVVFDFKMMTLFSMLFGAGVIVYAAKPAPGGKPPVGLWYRRMFWLLVIGLVHAYLIWIGDILVPYALSGLLLLWWMRRRSPRTLIIVASTFIIVGGLSWASRGLHLQLSNLSPEQREEINREFSPTPEQLKKEIDAYTGNYAGIVRFRAPDVFMLQTIFFPAFFLWRVGGVMLLGMALMKLRVLTGERSLHYYAILAVTGYAVGLPLIVGGIVLQQTINYQPPRTLYVDQFNYFGSVAIALGHAGLLIYLLKRDRLGPFRWPLAAVGRTAFTNYLMQSLICTTLFYGYGFGLFAQLDYAAQLVVVLAIWIVQLIVSPLWLKHFLFGPFEWLWRSLTYWRLQPMRRESVPALSRASTPSV
jgi:uncharacterized protein